MKTIINLVVAILLISCTSKKEMKDLNFLEGKWKVENKEFYEEWNIVNADSIQGEFYKILIGGKHIVENISISNRENKIVYQAKVLNQNNGETISFPLNLEEKSKFSFENLEHDFPKKIQYTKLSQTETFVEVLGNEKKNFSYKLFKQD